MAFWHVSENSVWTPYLSSKNAGVAEELRFARKLYPENRFLIERARQSGTGTLVRAGNFTTI